MSHKEIRKSIELYIYRDKNDFTIVLLALIFGFSLTLIDYKVFIEQFVIFYKIWLSIYLIIYFLFFDIIKVYNYSLQFSSNRISILKTYFLLLLKFVIKINFWLFSLTYICYFFRTDTLLEISNYFVFLFYTLIISTSCLLLYVFWENGLSLILIIMFLLFNFIVSSGSFGDTLFKVLPNIFFDNYVFFTNNIYINILYLNIIVGLIVIIFLNKNRI